MKRSLDSTFDGSKSEIKFQRQFPHVDGNYAGHINIPILGNAMSKLQSLALSRWKAANPSNASMVASSDCHISLSKSFVLRSHQIQPFLASLSETFNTLFQASSPSSLSEDHMVDVYSDSFTLDNDTKSRRFLCVEVDDFKESLKTLVKQVDCVMSDYQKEKYYMDPKFHISIGSYPTFDGNEGESIQDKKEDGDGSDKEENGDDETKEGDKTYYICTSDVDEDDMEENEEWKLPVSVSTIRCIIGDKHYLYRIGHDKAFSQQQQKHK